MRYWYSSRYLLKNIIPLSGRKVKKNPSNLPKFSCWMAGKLGESLDIFGGFAYNSKVVTLGDCKMLRIWVYRAVGFPRSMPSPCGAIRKRMRGTAKRWMRRASFRSVSGMIFLGVSRGFRIHPYGKTNPLSSSTTYGGPPSPLGKAHEETHR